MDINLFKSFYINWSPLFIVISRHGVVFILMTIRLAFITIDRHQSKVQRKVYTVSCGFLKHDEEDQVSDSKMYLMQNGNQLQD